MLEAFWLDVTTSKDECTWTRLTSVVFTRKRPFTEEFLILHCKIKKITCVLPANACCIVYVNCPPILHVFPFWNKQFTVYKFSIFNKHANPNNQPYYYIITFTQYTKIRNYFFWLTWRGNNSHCLHDRLPKVHSCQQTNTKLKTADKSEK